MSIRERIERQWKQIAAWKNYYNLLWKATEARTAYWRDRAYAAERRVDKLEARIKELSEMNSNGCDSLAAVYEERNRLRKVVAAAKRDGCGFTPLQEALRELDGEHDCPNQQVTPIEQCVHPDCIRAKEPSDES